MATGGQVRKGAAAPEHCTHVAAPPRPQTSALYAQCITERLSGLVFVLGVTTTPPIRDVGRGTRDGQSITPSLRCACTVPAWLSVVLAIDTTYGLVC